MPIHLDDIGGSAEVGLFGLATDKFLLLSKSVIPRKARLFSDILGVKASRVSIMGSILISPFIAANSNGIIISNLALDEEVQQIKKSIPEARVCVLNSRNTAVGNLILCNDKGAVASTVFSKNEVKEIEETLDVEVIQANIASRTYVGSLAVATNIGAVVYVEATDEEIKMLNEILRIHSYVGTVNDGVGFVRSGIIANSNGAIVGSRTTGPELLTITQALGP